MGPKVKTRRLSENTTSDEASTVIVDSIPEVTNPEGEKIDIDEEKFINVQIPVELESDDPESSLRRSQRIKTKGPVVNDFGFKTPAKISQRQRTRPTGGNTKSPLKRKNFNKPEEVTCFPGHCDVPALVDTLTCNGILFSKGDIVSCVDKDQNVYYAIIRGLLVDQFCEKSAVITWLLNTTDSPPPKKRFDPKTYSIGPDEEFPRKLDLFEFVMHCPWYYLIPKFSPPTLNPKIQKEFLIHYFKYVSYHQILRAS